MTPRSTPPSPFRPGEPMPTAPEVNNWLSELVRIAVEDQLGTLRAQVERLQARLDADES